jgi:maleylpyruvate isomerase
MTPNERSAAALPRVRAVHAELLDSLASPLDPSAPSLLDGWSIGHVIAHLARNADSVSRRLKAAGRCEHAVQYPGGPEGRAREIDEGASRGYPELCADLAEACALLESTAAGLAAEAWAVTSTSVAGVEQDAATVLERRIREVVIHRSDLGQGYRPRDWPPEVVAELDGELLGTLSARSDPVELAAWLTGRGPAPELRPWS